MKLINIIFTIRLLQPDVLTDKYDWLQEVTNNIDKIISDTIMQNKTEHVKDIEASKIVDAWLNLINSIPTHKKII